LSIVPVDEVNAKEEIRKASFFDGSFRVAMS